MPTTHLPEMPPFAKPHITCGSAPERATQHSSIRTVRPEREHCGGCGWSHERDEYAYLGSFADPREALRAAGLRSGHVGMISLPAGDGRMMAYVCAGRCCRDARESAEWIAARAKLDGATVSTMYSVDQTDEEAEIAAALEAHSERMYASSYGLGL